MAVFTEGARHSVWHILSLGSCYSALMGNVKALVDTSGEGQERDREKQRRRDRENETKMCNRDKI